MDPELVVAAQRGDREAFATLARASGDRLFGIARRILRDHERAEDAVQNALVIAWRELPRLRDPARFEAWLTRLLVNDCYEDYRRLAEYLGDDLVDAEAQRLKTELLAKPEALAAALAKLINGQVAP